jgi:chitinase
MADLAPITRKEKYLAKAGGQEVTLPPYRITREEMYLEKIANGGGGGSSTDYAASLRMTIDSSTYVVTAQLYNKGGDALGNPQTIDLPLESTVVSGSYDSNSKSLILTLVSGQTIAIPISSLIEGLLKGTNVGNAGLTVAENYIELANGQRLYISSTEPTGTIPNGSLGIGF